MKLSEYLDNIETKLQGSFDIERDYIINDYTYHMFARFNSRTERYIITRKTVIDAVETNEYCFIKHFTSINEDELQRFIDLLIKSIDLVIDFDHGHMSSFITGLIILDNKPSDHIIKKIEKYKYHKAFAFGFKGWVDIRLILVTMNEKYIVSNKKGREVLEVYSTEDL